MSKPCQALGHGAALWLERELLRCGREESSIIQMADDIAESESVPMRIKSTRSHCSAPAALGIGAVPQHREAGSQELSPSSFPACQRLVPVCPLSAWLRTRGRYAGPSDTLCQSTALGRIYCSRSEGICFQTTWGVIKMKTD